jgi:prepilin-type N-terminal cleavage/methylation domain-containing protein
VLVFLQQQIRHWSDITSGEDGFTLVELLVTMLILSILAAIALPAFANQASKARDSRAKEMANSAEVAMESCMTDSLGLYNACNVNALRAIDPTLPGSPTLKVSVPAKGTSYTITVQSDPKTQTFQVKRSAKGVVTFPCTKIGVVGCPTSGFWG